MFLKTFRVKSNTTIRGSDRRKLRSEIGNAFPSLSAEELGELIPNKEEMSVMRILTHSGENVTVYCLKGEPIFFEIEKRIFPTVYTIWRKPDIMLQFTTWPPVFEKLKGGADLMLPGVVLPQEMGVKSFGTFEKDTPCSINLKGNKAAIAVGVTAVSSRDLTEDGMRGKGVIVFHTYLDNLWAQGSKMNLPLIDETANEKPGSTEEKGPFDGSKMNIDDTSLLLGTESEEHMVDYKSRVGTVIEDLTDLKVVEDRLEATPIDNIETSEEASTGLCRDSAAARSATAGVFDSSVTTVEDAAQSDEVLPETEKTPQEQMDELLEYCFLCALLRMKKSDILPLLTSAFYKNHILSSCPEGASIDVKKSSYKKLSKFLQSMQQRNFIVVKELSKGVDSICEVNWAHEKLKEFKKTQPTLIQCGSADKSAETPLTSQEGPKIEELFSVSGSTVGIFGERGYKRGDILTAAEIRSAITSYVKSNELVCENNKKLVVLDPTLTKALVNKNDSVDCLQWDELISRVLGKMNDCHRITFPGKQPIIRKGKIEAVEIKIEQRMGNKKVTLVSNLESYGVDPQEFAHTLQIRAASSTSVSQLPGKHKTPGMQVMIQGKHVPLVAAALLDDYKIPKKYIAGLELMKGGKKKK